MQLDAEIVNIAAIVITELWRESISFKVRATGPTIKTEPEEEKAEDPSERACTFLVVPAAIFAVHTCPVTALGTGMPKV